MRPHQCRGTPTDASRQLLQETVMPQAAPPRSQQSYRHEAFMWRDADDYASVLGPFVEDGLARRRGGDGRCRAAPCQLVARKPRFSGAQGEIRRHGQARPESRHESFPPGKSLLISTRATGVPVRGIGEPIWAGRRPEEILECQLHEALLNVAVDPKIPLWLICPVRPRRA